MMQVTVAVTKWPQSLVPLGPNIAGSISACSKMTLVINSYGMDWAAKEAVEMPSSAGPATGICKKYSTVCRPSSVSAAIQTQLET